MNNNLFTIGEISKMKNMTAKALRFYDKIGLLKPYHVDQTNQYRYYHTSQLLHIDIIKAARNLEISPNELIPLFKNQDTSGLITLLETHKEHTEAKIRKLQEVITGVEHIRDNIITAEEVLANDNVYIKEMPDRHIITIPWVENTDPQEILNDFSRLDNLVDALQGIATHETGILYKISEKSTLPDMLFTSIAKPIDTSQYRLLPKGTYHCVNFTESNAITRQELLNNYIAQHQITPLIIVQAELLTGLFRSGQSAWELQLKA